jgi:hypothetical protein
VCAIEVLQHCCRSSSHSVSDSDVRIAARVATRFHGALQYFVERHHCVYIREVRLVSAH